MQVKVLLGRDENAIMIAATRYALPRCLHIPIAARDIAAIERYIGKTTVVAKDKAGRCALLVAVGAPEEMDETLVIWDIPESVVLHRSPQVWVHVDLRAYRKAYALARPEDRISNKDLDHVRNRRVARVMGFDYVRLVPITRGVNASSGGLTEKWEVAFQQLPENKAWHAANPTCIQYGDIADLAKMMDMKMESGQHDPVNVLQKRLREERRQAPL